MKLHCIRHAPVVSTGICYGQRNVAVKTFKVKAEIRKVVGFSELIFSSPSLRCREMAIAYAREQGIIVDARLMEMSFGEWEGKAWSALPRSQLDIWANNVKDFTAPKGESFSKLVSRVNQWLNELPNNSDNCTVFTHAGVVKALLVIINGCSFENAAVYEVPHHQLVSFDI